MIAGVGSKATTGMYGVVLISPYCEGWSYEVEEVSYDEHEPVKYDIDKEDA